MDLFDHDVRLRPRKARQYRTGNPGSEAVSDRRDKGIGVRRESRLTSEAACGLKSAQPDLPDLKCGHSGLWYDPSSFGSLPKEGGQQLSEVPYSFISLTASPRQINLIVYVRY